VQFEVIKRDIDGFVGIILNERILRKFEELRWLWVDFNGLMSLNGI